MPANKPLQLSAQSVGLLPRSQEIFDGDPDVPSDLAEKSWRDVPTRVERNCRCPTIWVAILPVEFSRGFSTGTLPTPYAIRLVRGKKLRGGVLL